MIGFSGYAHHNSDLELILNDLLASMGDAITSEQGSIAWCEAYTLAISFNAFLNYIQLLANQLTPSDISIFADRWAKIFNLPYQNNGNLPSNIAAIQKQISFKQALFGTFPNVSNVSQYIKAILGQIFIDLEYRQELQPTATNNPAVQITQDGYSYFSPLSLVLVRVWQPRDNKDNLLMPTNVFLNTVDQYKSFVIDWIPADIGIENMQLIYDGYDGYSNYGTGFDVITITAGSTTVSGVNTKFTHCFDVVDSLGYLAPLEVVDDNNVLQTFLVSHVSDDLHLTIKNPAPNNVTSRTFRCLGVQFDTSYVLDTALFGQNGL